MNALLFDETISARGGKSPAFGDQSDELVEHVLGIARPAAGLGVKLHRHDRQRFVHQAFDSAIVQIEMRDAQPAAGDTVGINGIPMILRGDMHRSLPHQIFHRMI